MNAKTIQSNIFRESLETLWPKWPIDILSYQNPIDWWEVVKYKIKHLTIEISKSLNITKDKIIKLEKRLNEIKDSESLALIREYNFLNQQIKAYYEKQLEAARIRSRIQTYEEGEKSTKFFLNVEKKNVSDKTWSRIKCQNGTYSSNINTIINEQKTYYKALFTSEGSNETEAVKLLEHVDKTLNLEQKHFCDAEINEKEIEDTIKLLKINKSPGDDGIICEFYKEYWYLRWW